MAERKRSSRAGSGGSTGCLVWLLLLSGVFLLFLLNWGRIRETLERTNFTEVVKTQREAERPASPVPPAPKVEAPLAEPSGPAAEPGPRAALPLEAEEPSAEELPAAPRGPSGADPAREAPARAAEPAKPEGRPARPSEPGAAAKAPARTRSALLYFVRIDEDGVIVRQEVKRSVPATDSPLTDALGALLRGPAEEELRKSLLSLVPEGTVLLSAQVRGSTAFLNFNEAFMYNRYGIEGYAGQLKQVVYTATAFPTVHDVQILIEGERHDYLGGEGIYVGRPLSRNSF